MRDKDRQLLDAIKQRNVSEVNRLLSVGAEANSLDEEKGHPLNNEGKEDLDGRKQRNLN